MCMPGTYAARPDCTACLPAFMAMDAIIWLRNATKMDVLASESEFTAAKLKFEAKYRQASRGWIAQGLERLGKRLAGCCGKLGRSVATSSP